MSADCIFCKIVAGEIPSTKVYEDDDVLAFMDIGPIIKGHVLVIPKAHHDPLTETPIDVLTKLIAVVQRVIRAQEQGLGAEGSNVIQNNGKVAGQLVPHVHIHVIPRFAKDGHQWNWATKEYANPEETKEYADAIKAKLK